MDSCLVMSAFLCAEICSRIKGKSTRLSSHTHIRLHNNCGTSSKCWVLYLSVRLMWDRPCVCVCCQCGCSHEIFLSSLLLLFFSLLFMCLSSHWSLSLFISFFSLVYFHLLFTFLLFSSHLVCSLSHLYSFITFSSHLVSRCLISSFLVSTCLFSFHLYSFLFIINFFSSLHFSSHLASSHLFSILFLFQLNSNELYWLDKLYIPVPKHL